MKSAARIALNNFKPYVHFPNGKCSAGGANISNVFGLGYPVSPYGGPNPLPITNHVVAPLRFVTNAGAAPSIPPPQPSNLPGGLTGFPKAGGINNT